MPERRSRGASYTDRFRTDVPFSQPSIHDAPLRSGSSPSDVSVPQILALIGRATSSRLAEPNLAMNLQIADLVNAKKGSAPREVAMRLAKDANSQSAMTAVLALGVLDVCVKNCGYAFHLAISRRDFLNQLVRKFPERPPIHYSRVQTLVLEMIEEWTCTLVKTARYRDDLGYIRDMHRLLSYKGYVFPEINEDELAVLAPEQDSLKSAAELEKEDRERQSAKLQELIRSGSPEDLKEANRLMSVMAGFRESQVDYRAKVAADLDKVRRTQELLSASIDNIVANHPDPVFVDLAQTLTSALPKLTQLLADEESMTEDEEARVKISTLQTDVKSVLNLYNAATKGEPMPKSATNNLDSLISFGDDESESTSDDLLALGSLSLGPNTADILDMNAQQDRQTTPQTASPELSTPTLATPTSASPAPSYSGFSSAANSTVNSSAADDPFDVFTSSTPSPTATPKTTAVVKAYADDSLRVAYSSTKAGNTTTVTLYFSNPGSKKISGFETQLAQPRSLTMEIQPLSSTQIEPKAQCTQQVVLKGEAAPKLRWKANYSFGLDKKSVTGDLKSI